MIRQTIEKVLVYVIAVILAALITVAYVEGEAGAVSRDKDPLTFWWLVSMSVGGPDALLVFGAAE